MPYVRKDQIALKMRKNDTLYCFIIFPVVVKQQ